MRKLNRRITTNKNNFKIKQENISDVKQYISMYILNRYYIYFVCTL